MHLFPAVFYGLTSKYQIKYVFYEEGCFGIFVTRVHGAVGHLKCGTKSYHNTGVWNCGL
jgi:hypothetical protein